MLCPFLFWNKRCSGVNNGCYFYFLCLHYVRFTQLIMWITLQECKFVFQVQCSSRPSRDLNSRNWFCFFSAKQSGFIVSAASTFHLYRCHVLQSFLRSVFYLKQSDEAEWKRPNPFVAINVECIFVCCCNASGSLCGCLATNRWRVTWSSFNCCYSNRAKILYYTQNAGFSVADLICWPLFLVEGNMDVDMWYVFL